jgi:hypothetical protein
MSATSLCKDPHTADSIDKAIFGHPHHAFQPYIARSRQAGDCADNLGHANIDVTQIVLWQEPVGRAVDVIA